MAFYPVGVEEVVAEVVFGEVEGDEEACVVGREGGRSRQGYCKFGTMRLLVFVGKERGGGEVQEDLLAAECYYLLADGYSVHDEVEGHAQSQLRWEAVDG